MATDIETLTRRFWPKVKKTSACWLWTAAKSSPGYPLFWRDGKFILGHRFAYEISKGTIPDGYDIDHLCRNTLCVNPDHLEAVPHRENILRGRSQSAAQTKQTMCKRGHPFTYQFTDKHGSVHRECRVCMTDRQRKRRATARG